ncbi:MAG: hypothetical protein SVU32_05320 [Candidatus Nanohaloarchaea archaeon]|nr:hypothetical protein [Candidatus Nanohaloarchaea archaeon]
MGGRSPVELYDTARNYIDTVSESLEERFGDRASYQVAKDVYHEFHDHLDVYFPLYTGARLQAFRESTQYPVFEKWLNWWGGDKLVHAGFSYGITGLTWRGMEHTERATDRTLNTLDELEAHVELEDLRDADELDELLEDRDNLEEEEILDQYEEDEDVSDMDVLESKDGETSYTEHFLDAAVDSRAEDYVRSTLEGINEATGDPRARAAVGFLAVGGFSLVKEFVLDGDPDGLDIAANYVGWGLYMAKEYHNIESWSNWGKEKIGRHTDLEELYVDIMGEDDTDRGQGTAEPASIREGFAWLDRGQDETEEDLDELL